MSTVLDLPSSAELLYKPNATKSLDNTGMQAQIGWVCDYADEDAFMSVCNGSLDNVGGGATRLVPLRHPTYSNMLAYSVKSEGFGHDASITANPFGYQYKKSRILVSFKTYPFAIVGDSPFMTVKLKHGTQGYSIPGQSMTFPSTGKKIEGVDASIEVNTTAYMVTLYQCPNLDDDLITSLCNRVNSSPIFNRDVGTVRFDGGDSDYALTITGQLSYTKSLTFLWREIPWNQLINPSGDWEAPERVSDSSNIYKSADLNQLFN